MINASDPLVITTISFIQCKTKFASKQVVFISLRFCFSSKEYIPNGHSVVKNHPESNKSESHHHHDLFQSVISEKLKNLDVGSKSSVSNFLIINNFYAFSVLKQWKFNFLTERVLDSAR